jgi:membrane protease subunit HflC
MRSLNGVALAAIAVVAIILVSMATFIVNPTEQALILRFGQPVRDLIDAPGLYFKWPFVDTVVYIDKRILALDNERQEVLVADNQRLEVDAFVRYHIADPLLFYQSVGDTRGADAQLGGMQSIGGVDHRYRARQARRADGRHQGSDDRGRQALRP